MAQLVLAIVYAAAATFAAAVVVRFLRIRRLPRQVRWEIYPVPHEGRRARHGGSRMEESNYWDKPRRRDRLEELRFMIPEMLLLKGLWEHNRRLWYRSFPFHFGLYLLILATIAVFAATVAERLALPGRDVLELAASTAVGAGAVLGLVGALGLLWMRATDREMRPYTNPSHFFNLAFFVVVLALIATIYVRAGMTAEPFRAWSSALLAADASLLPADALSRSTLAFCALLIAWVPLTHMSHFFVKWFTWHQIRWDDEPYVRGGRIEKMIEKALNSPVTWSAPHIGADGRKTWADIATEGVRDE
ncbi:MAG: respiratory nitrate reductase subunit gamma [Acidobacteriota bacterium]